MTHLLNLDYNTPRASTKPIRFSISRQHTNEFQADLFLKKNGKKFSFTKNTRDLAIGSCSSLANSNAELTVNFIGNGQTARLLLELEGGALDVSHKISTKPLTGKQRIHFSIFFKPQ